MIQRRQMLEMVRTLHQSMDGRVQREAVAAQHTNASKNATHSVNYDHQDNSLPA